MSSIAILGPGGVGGFLATLLTRADEHVNVIAREPTAELIAAQGIALESVIFGELSARPLAAPELISPTDFLLVAPKATALSEALERIRVTPRLVVPVLNGLDHMAVLRARFGDAHVAAGAIRIEADRPQPGRVVHTSPSVRVELAADDVTLAGEVRELGEILKRAGIPTEIGVSEAQVLWSKLVRLAPLACTTSAADRPIGFIRSDPHWRPVLKTAIAETAAVANADGAEIDPSGPLAELDAAHPTLRSSMQRDIAAGREPELDAIPGAVLRAAGRHGLRCPTMRRLVVRIEHRLKVAARAR